MSCLKSLCAWFLVISLGYGQIVDVPSPMRPDDVIEFVETVAADDIDGPVECGGEYSQDTGRISSPGYPVQNYSSQSSCIWSIRVEEGKALVMNFEYMDVEIGPPECPFDGVIVVDNSESVPFTPGPNPFNDTNPVPEILGIFCGNELFSPFVSTTNFVRVGFYSDLDAERGGFVLTWRTVDAKPTVHQECDFEGGLCDGWLNVERGDKFDWTIFSGQTPSSGTGPHFDHTKQNEDGVYAYIESSRPRVANDIALLLSPETKFQEDDPDYCLDFWYHMHGSKVGSLGAGLLIGNTQERKWVKSGDQGNQWNHESITIKRIDSPFKVIFAGFVGQNHEGDIAIDDIKLYGKPCTELTHQDRMPLLDKAIGAYTEPCAKENEFLCENSSTCISKEKLCDGIVDCPQMDDENSETCKNATFLPPPIDTTDGTPLEETTEGNAMSINLDVIAFPHVYCITGDTFEDTTIDDLLDTTTDFVDITTEDTLQFVQGTTATVPGETTLFEISTSPEDTTSSDLDLVAESTESPLDDTTIVLTREATNPVPTTTSLPSNPDATEPELTTLEDDIATTDGFEYLVITDEATSIIATDSDVITTKSVIVSGVAGAKPNVDTSFTTAISDLATTGTFKTTEFAETEKDIEKLVTTAIFRTTSRVKSVHQKSRETTSGIPATTASTVDESTSELHMKQNVDITTAESGKPTAAVDTKDVQHVLTSPTAMLGDSTNSSFVTSKPKTTTLKSEPTTVSAEVSRHQHSHSSTINSRKGSTRSPDRAATKLPKTIDTTTQMHVVGNMEVPTIADKQKGKENGSSVTSPTSYFVLSIAMLFSLTNIL